jgi:hypothetical protein
MRDYTPTDLEAFVRQRAPEIARAIQAAAQRSANEADLRGKVEPILERFASNFDITLRLERERTLVNGRADAVYNRFVVEYEPPGSLRRERNARPNQHAVEQVQRYLEGLERMDRHRKERLAGAVLDGHYFIFVRFREGHWHVDDPVPVSPHSTETFLRYLLSLSTELALTPENLVRDFGENTVVSRMAVSALYQALRTCSHPRVQTLFQQWQRQFREICGYEEGSTRLDVAQLARSYGVKDPSPSALHLFFAIHTYYAALHQTAGRADCPLLPDAQSRHRPGPGRLGRHGGPAGLPAQDGTGRRLRRLRHPQLPGGDFFGWYLDAWDADVEQALRRIIGDLANYSLVTLDVDPEETRDLLKQLYQNLMPRTAAPRPGRVLHPRLAGGAAAQPTGRGRRPG